MQRSQRLVKELAKLAENPPKGISVSEKEDKLNILEAQITGPENSPYKEGIFNLEILLPENYPFSPPTIRFLTKVYHPNIDENGLICLDLLKTKPNGSWRPTFGIENVLIAIRMLLSSPNPEDPLMVDIAEEYKNNKKEYERKALEMCKTYAAK